MLTGKQKSVDLDTVDLDTIEKKLSDVLEKEKIHLLSALVNRSTKELDNVYISWVSAKYGANPNFDLEFIARLLEVSKTTISNYINNKFAHISMDNQKKIQKIIEIIGYVPNQTARTIKQNIKKSYGLIANISHTPSREYVNTILTNLQEKCFDVGYTLQIYDVEQKSHVDCIKKMQFLGLIDGLFILGSNLGFGEYDLLEQYRIPVVLLNPWSENHIKSKNILATVGSSLDGFENLLAYYREHISSRACLLTIPVAGFAQRQDKIDMFHSYYPDQRVVYLDDYSPSSVEKIFDEIKDYEEELFICLSDMTAISLKEKFLQVGRRVEVTGYDNSDLAEIFKISTIDHNLIQQAQRAFEVMHSNTSKKNNKAENNQKTFSYRKIMLENIFINKLYHKEEL